MSEKSSQHTAALVGVSSRTVERMREVIDSGDEDLIAVRRSRCCSMALYSPAAPRGRPSEETEGGEMSPKLLLDNFPCRDLTRAEVCKIAKALAAGANRAWEGYEYTVQNSHLGGQLLKIEASIFEEALHILRAILTEGKPREEMPQNGDCK